MTDDLDKLKAALEAATPAPDAGRKAADLALAQKNFADLQGSRAAPRPKSDGPDRGFWTGAKKMIGTMTSRSGLVVTTAMVAVGLAVLTPLGQKLLTPGDLPTAVAPSPVELRDLGLETDGIVQEEAPALAEPVVSPSTQRFRDQALSKAAPEAEAGTSLAQTRQGGRAISPAPFQALDADDRIAAVPEGNTEAYSNEADNPLKVVAEHPVSTFSVDVDTASYAVVRNSLNNGQLPPQGAVRVEEMINYFPYDYAAPGDGDAFRPTVSVSPTPWNDGTQLVHIGIQGALPDLADRPPLNLVFLIDTSGSMNQPNKLPLLIQSFSMMLGELHDSDQVAIVAYAGSAGQVLEPTPAREKAKILNALTQLGAGGSTAGQQGLQQAYSVAETMTEDGQIARVILATDGDFNVGLSDPGALKDFIAAKRKSGTYLSVLGFGRGNLDDATMQALAQNGNGTAAYIDTLNEAQKVLVDQLSGALYPIADDVKIQVEFNPAEVAEYRLIGYETRALAREDFNNDKVDAGDIGAGHQVTALYEVTPVGSGARLTDPLRYGADQADGDTSGELGFLRLRYKAPGNDTSRLIEMPITAGLEPQSDAGFAIAVAGFGQLLRGSDYLGNWGWSDAIALANANKATDPFGYRAEAVQLMRLAETLSR